MSQSFDPYHKWLGISPKEQPPTLYRLLGIELFESDRDVIEAAADQRMAHVRTYQTGQNSALSQRILNELSAARICLLDSGKKAAYDERLSRELAVKAAQAASKQAAREPAAEVVPLTELDEAVSSIESGMQTIRPSAARGAKRRKKSTAPVILVVAIALVGLPIVWLVLNGNRQQSPSAPNQDAAARETRDASSPVKPKEQKPTQSDGQQVTRTANDGRVSPSRPEMKASSDLQVAEEELLRGGEGPPIPAAETSPGKEPAGPLRIFEDEPEFAAALTSGDGKLEFVSDEAYSGKASVKVSPGQRFSAMLPGLNVKIRKQPAAPDEYRYLRFAWKKLGGGEIWLQLRHPSDWFRYHAGPKGYGWPGILVTDELPTEFVVVTRDLAADFGEFTLTGFALTANDGEWAWFDHIHLARSLDDFEPIVPDAAAPVAFDLLEKVDVAADRVNGDWKREDAALISPEQPAARVQLPYAPNGDYELTVVAERLTGVDSFVVGLVVDGRQVAMTLDGYGGETAGLADLDHHDGATNETTRRGPRLPPGDSHTVVCTVRHGSVRVVCDGKEALKWSGDASRLSNSDFWEVPDKRRLFLGAWDSQFKYTRVEIRPLSPAEVVEKASEGRPPARQLADLASNEALRQPVPEGDVLRKARQEMQRKYAAESAVAHSPALQLKLAEKLLAKAADAERPDAGGYVMLQQARDLAETAGDLGLAWRTIDELSRSFDVESVPLRQESLTRVGKVAKSPDQSRDLADHACRLIARALAAGRVDLVKKVAAQAQGFAKRSKDTVLVKTVASRASDALKLAGDGDRVAEARKMLKETPDDAKANFIVGRYELCAAGEREAALAKLAKGDDAGWQKLANDDMAASRDRTGRQEQLVLADAWWERAENESWPGRHYLRMRSAEWYRRAMSSLAGEEKTRVVERLKELLAMDEGLPAWELFAIRRGQKFDTFVRIEPGGSLRTCVDYDGPMDISFAARTDSLNIRLFVHGYPSVIWNWEVNPSELRVERPGGETIPVAVTPLEPNRWYAFRYRITPQGTNITVDGASVFAEDHAYSRFPQSPVGVNGEGPAVIEVKKLMIKPL